MNLNKRQLQKEANQHHYVRDTYEKVVRLVDILSYIRSEQFLFEHLALKGGTAINLTIFDLPRLSVDIDLDYTNNSSRDDMLKDRKIVKSLLINYLKKKTVISLVKIYVNIMLLTALKRPILMPEEISITSK